MPSIKIQNPLKDSDWDDRLREYPESTLFHTSAWARVLHETYGYQPVYLSMVRSGEKPVCLPMMEINSWLTGRRGASLPFTDECPPLGSDATIQPRLIDAIREEARKRGWKQVEYRGGGVWLDEPTRSVSYHGHRLDLTQGKHAIWGNMESSVRRSTKKSEQLGVQCEMTTELKAMREFYSLMCLTRRRHGLPPQPFTFFANVQRLLLARGNGFMVMARLKKSAVAAAIYLHHGTKMIYKWGASNERYASLRGNNAVMWHAIQHGINLGMKEMNFGRTSIDQEGLRRFKLGWGTTEYLIEYLKYDVKQDAYVTASDETSGWHQICFRRMPMSVSRGIGAFLYRHVG